MLIGGPAVFLALLVYLTLIGPALSGRARLNKELPQLRADAAEMRDLYTQATKLAEKAAISLTPMTKEYVETSLVRKGLKAQSIALTGEFAKVQMSDVPFAGVINWLDELQRTSRITVVEASFGAQTAVGSVNVNLTLRQQKSEQN